MPTVVTKTYEKFLGIDKRSSGVTVSPDAATSAVNAAYFNQTTLTSRQGYQCLGGDTSAIGMFRYLKYDSTLGYAVPEILIAGTGLRRVKSTTFSISFTDPAGGGGGSLPDYFPGYFGGAFGGRYWGLPTGGGSSSSDAASPAAAMLVGSDGNWHFYIDLFGANALDFNCGKGFDETSSPTLAQLRTAILAIPGFSVTMSSSLYTKEAAFIPTFDYVAFDGTGALTVTYLYHELVSTPTGYSSLFAGLYAKRDSDEFQVASGVDMRDSLFVATGFDPLIQYDGQKAYKVGIPVPTAVPTLSLSSGGNVTGTNINYAYRYTYVDNMGYRHDGQTSTGSALTSPASQKVNVAITAIQASTGYNTDQAKLAASPATQAGTTFTVLTGNSLKVGDRVFLRDNAGAEVERTVTASSDTSLTLSGSALTLGASSVVSCLRVEVMRSTIQGGIFYSVGEFPHDSSGATFTIIDNSATVGDAPLDLDPLPEPPPANLKCLAKHQGMLFGAVDDRVYFSSAEDCAAWSGLRYFDNTNGPGPVTAIASVNEVLGVWKASSYSAAVGIVDTGAFDFQEISAEIGNISHAATKAAAGSVIFLSDKGVFVVTGVDIPQPAGPQVKPILTAVETDTSLQLKLKQAVGAIDSLNELYLLFIPCFSISSPSVYANASSIILSFEWPTQRWLEWSGWDWTGGAVVDGKDLWFAERRFSSEMDAIQTKLHRRINSGTWIDYTDNGDPIAWEYSPGWEDLDRPTSMKKATRFKLYSNDPRRAGNFTLLVRTEKDFVEGVTESEFPLVFGSGTSGEYGWGYGPWGYEPWGHPTTPWETRRLRGSKCRAIRARFLHEENYKYPMITGWELEITAFDERIS
jgi:hypothetical protein